MVFSQCLVKLLYISLTTGSLFLQQKVSTVQHGGYDPMPPNVNGTLPGGTTRTLPHNHQQNNPHQSSPHHHHHTLPPQHKNYSPHHQHHHQSPKHAIPTTSSGVTAEGPSGHQPPMMRSFSSPQHQPAATVMPRSMHREHYQPLTQHDLEVGGKYIILESFFYNSLLNMLLLCNLEEKRAQEKTFFSR